MKKLYNYPEINLIAFQEGDILAEVSLGPGGAIGTGEPEIGWDPLDSGLSVSDPGVILNPGE